MAPAGNLATSFASGVRLVFEGFALLRRERRLWPLAAVPSLLSILAVSGALALIAGFTGELYALATGWAPALEVERWYAWLWLGPAKLALWVLGVAVFVALAGAGVVAAYLLASLLASPFHDALAQRVERILTGRVLDETGSGLSALLLGAARALRAEARRIAFFVSVIAPLTLMGLVVPGAQLVTGPAIAGFTILFLPLDYAGYTLDRRLLPFAARRRWILSHVSTMAGFGSAAFLTCLVPGLNVVAMPVLVVAGTLLPVRFPPQPLAAPAEASGSSASARGRGS